MRYEYKCTKCGITTNRVVHRFEEADEQYCTYEDRFSEDEEDDEDIPDDEASTVCGGKLERIVFPDEGGRCSVVMRPQGGYQMGAVLKDGTTIPGHFGRDAARRRRPAKKPLKEAKPT